MITNPLLPDFLFERKEEAVSIDSALHITGFSAGAQRLAAEPSAVVVGTDLRTAFPEFVGAEEIISAILRGTEHTWSPGVIQRESGNDEPLYVAVRVEHDPSRSVAIIRLLDVTAQMTMEHRLVQQSNQAALLVEALHISRAYLENIIDSMAEVLFVTSPDGTIRMANRSATAILDFTRDELAGMNVRTLFAEDKVTLPAGDRLRLHEEIRSLNREIFCRTKKDAVLPLAFSVTVLEDGDRETGTLLWLGRDLREIAQAKKEIDTLQKENAYLLEEIKGEHNFEEIVGISNAIRKVFRQIDKVAATDATVLLTGETGTGKELIARAIHNRSVRSGHVMVKVNCAALPAGLVESELFGHEKGAFTGASSRKIGKFELAHHGTIFLDEVGELPLETQAKLLRILQEKEFERVGGTQTLGVDVRVVAATNKELDELVQAGGFREDLYYRLHVFPIEVPPLRNRLGDIPLLAQYFLGKFSGSMSKRIRGIAPETLEKLNMYHWPGNVRELANVIERAVILCEEPVLQGVDLGVSPRSSRQESSLAEIERNHIITVLNDCSGVIEGSRGAASKLGLHPATLRSRMKKLGIRRSGRSFQ